MVRQEISDGQESLWTAQEIRFMSSEEPGPVVDVARRAEELTEVMTLLNLNSRTSGFLAATAIESPHRPDIESTYGRRTDRVVEGAARLANEREIPIKDAFARATGMYALMKSGFDADEVQAMTKGMFEEFTAKYGVGNANAASRRHGLNTIRRSATTITGRKLLGNR